MNFRIIKYGTKLFFPFMFAYFGWMRKFSKNPSKYPLELRFKLQLHLSQKKKLKRLLLLENALKFLMGNF